MMGIAGAFRWLLILAAGIVGSVLALDFFGIPALIFESALLAVAAFTRMPVLALSVGLGAAVFLVLVIRAVWLCDPSVQDCSPTWQIGVFLIWLAALAAAGTIVALRVRKTETA